MTENKGLPGSPVSFEEMGDKVKIFLDSIKNNARYIYLVEDHIIREFREFYTPNLPYELYHEDDDNNIYVKNGVFQFEQESQGALEGYLPINLVSANDNSQTLDVMSFREFMYVYCNPEGIYILEKLGFIVNTLDYDSEDEKRRKVLGLPSPSEMTAMDYDDEIPF